MVELRENLEYHETKLGKFYLPSNSDDDIVCQAIKSSQLFDYKVVAEIERLYRKDSIILDVGANFGQMAVAFSRFCLSQEDIQSIDIDEERVKILCFEAEPFVAELLKMNITANALDRFIKVYEAPVWETSNKEIAFPEPDFVRFDSWGSYGLSPKLKSGRMFKTITIDSLNLVDSISVMKIDVQGSDLFAMKGAYETIMYHRMPIIFEFEQLFSEDFDVIFEDYVTFIKKINYRFQKVIENNYLIVPCES